MKSISVFAMAVLALSAPVIASKKYPASKNSLETALKSDVRLTTTKLDGSVSSIGTKFTVRMDNIKAVPSTYAPVTNVVENGERKEANIASRLVIGAINKTERKISGMQIEPGSQVGVKKIEVGKDSVSLYIITLKAEKVDVKGDTESEYLHTLLFFRFRDLDTMDSASVKQAIYSALEPEIEPQVALTSAPATEKALAKPTQDANSSPGSSATNGNGLVGKTTAELIQLLGGNYRTVVVGERTIYVFPELGIRVPVINGKVVAGQ